MGDCVVHYFTDDWKYYEKMEGYYRDEIGEGLLKFGPTKLPHYTLLEGTTASERARFKRATSPRDACIEFTCMALMDKFIGTAGSTVTGLVRALNHRYANEFQSVTFIGEYDLPSGLTRAFKDQVTACAQSLGDKMP